jgi:hypothetical protein
MRPTVLLALGVSLLACGSAVSQQATNSAELSGLEVISRNWTKIVSRPNSPSATPNSQTIAREDHNERNRPFEPVDPAPKTARTPPNWEYFLYSATVLNRGQKEVKSLMWHYVFSDPVTHAELKRQTGFSSESIGVNKKKTLQIRSRSSPPRVVNADSLGGLGTGFEERISIECIEFADGSFWEAASAKGSACERFRNWRRHK